MIPPLLILPLFALAQATAEEFSGQVVGAKDGDSLIIVRDGKRLDVRLEGIDCPELDQPYGEEAKRAMSSLAVGKKVTVKTKGTDDYDRTRAIVILPDGRELNRELLRSGHAWWYRRYSPDESWGDLEAEARQHHRGLWADPQPEPPWDWRAAQRNNSRPPSATAKVTPNGVAIIALLPNPVGRDDGREQVTIGNSSDRDVGLRGWRLWDRARNSYALSGSVARGKQRIVTLSDSTMPLNNGGDEVLLVDNHGIVRCRIEYRAEQARPGAVVRPEH